MTKHSKEAERLRKIVEAFPKVTITVLGDLVADEFVYGEISRRSEEHTSELQSRPHLVWRLLLEKKNKSLRPRTRNDIANRCRTVVPKNAVAGSVAWGRSRFGGRSHTLRSQRCRLAL